MKRADEVPEGRGSSAGRLGADRGAGTVLVLTGMAALLALGLVGVALAGVLIGRTRAAGAADLAALAGASAALSGQAEACRQAGRVAAANAARLDNCQLTGTDIWVEVSRKTPVGVQRLLRAPRVARARAHAELVPDPRGR